MKTGWIVVWAALQMAACSAPGVRCDGHLSPINAPAKVTSTAPAAKVSTARVRP